MQCVDLVCGAARHILDADGGLDEAFRELVTVTSQCRDDAAGEGEWSKLVVAYAAVTRITFRERGVNGRSVLDTWETSCEVPVERTGDAGGSGRFGLGGQRLEICAPVLTLFLLGFDDRGD